MKNLVNKIQYAIDSTKTQGIGSLLNASWATLYTMKHLPSRVLNKPMWAQIEITNICNLKCKMCAHSAKKWRGQVKPKNLTLQEFKLIIKQLPFVRFALINGVGEPLLNPHLLEIIQYANSKGIKTVFFTNATLLTPDKTKELINTDGLVNINVSIDAGSPETYARIRRGASFSEVCNNVKNFIDIRDALGRNKPNLSVWMVAMRENIKEVPLLIEALEKMSVRNLNIQNFSKADEIEGEPISADDILLLEEYKEMASKKNINLLFGKIPDGNVNRTETRTCNDPWKMVYVNVDGWINPCCAGFRYKNNYFANIFEDDLDEIWNNDSFKGFRHELKTGMPGCCLKCPRHNQRKDAFKL